MYFRSQVVGKSKADLVVDNKIIIEIKAVKCLLPEHEAQIINYLRATKIEIGLLMNFGKKPVCQTRCIWISELTDIYDNKRKKIRSNQ